MWDNSNMWSTGSTFDLRVAATVKTYPYWFSPDGINQRVTGL